MGETEDAMQTILAYVVGDDGTGEAHAQFVRLMFVCNQISWACDKIREAAEAFLEGGE
jgi:hypothetical protein